MQIYLRVGVRHFAQRSHVAPNGAYMIRTTPGNYKHVAPTALALLSDFPTKGLNDSLNRARFNPPEAGNESRVTEPGQFLYCLMPVFPAV